MKYKGYVGQIQYDDQAQIFHGDVIGIQDVIIFQGRSIQDVQQAFQDSIDDYLQFCASRGQNPEKNLENNIIQKQQRIS